MFFEFRLVPISLIVLGWGYQPERLQATNYLVLYMVGARLPFLLSIFLLYYFNGHCSFYLSLWNFVFFYDLRVW